MNRGVLVGAAIVGGLALSTIRKPGGGSVLSDSINEIKTMTTGTPRGIRNNNPGNIEFNKFNDWQGQTGTDGRFSTFDTMANGVRALTILLINYYTKYGAVSVAQILERYAPSHENDTGGYIDFVANRVGVAPYEMLNLNEHILDLVAAIIRFETGRDIAAPDLVEGFGMGMAAKGLNTQYAMYADKMQERLA